MISKNLKVFLISFCLSLPFWWGTNTLEDVLTRFFFLQELQTNPEWQAAYAAQIKIEAMLQGAYPLSTKQAQSLSVDAHAVLSTLVKEDGSTKILFEKNGQAPLPIASLTKLMTGLVALKNYSPEQDVFITEQAVGELGETGMLKAGDVFPVKDLLHLALMESSNDAAAALAQPVGRTEFVAAMNHEASALGLGNTSFVNPTGLDSIAPRGNYSTATELTQLSVYLSREYPQVFDILSQQRLNLYTADGRFHHAMTNTNVLLDWRDWPAKILGGKTGLTPQAKQCLLLVLESPDKKGYIINVILGSDDRFGEMEKLLRWTLNSYQWNLPQ